jgi:hypothetical protein
MSILAIESVQAHLDDLQREAAQRRQVSRARHASADAKRASDQPVRGFSHVRRVLGARS